MFPRFRLPAALLAAALTCLLPATGNAQAAKTTTLRVASAGGLFTDLQRRYAAEIFTRQTGIKVEFIDGNAHDHLTKLVAARGRNVPFDVAYLDEDVHDAAVRLKLVQKIDPAIVTNLEHIIDKAKSPENYGPFLQFLSTGIAFNRKKFQEAGIPTPTSWKDLWDPRLAGKIAIPELSHPTGRGFVIAAARLEGSDERDLSKGIESIAKIKAHSYFSSTVQAEALFTTGDVWAAPMPSGRAWGLHAKNRDIWFFDPKEGGVSSPYVIDVVAGTPNAKAANEYVNAVLHPLQQLGQATELSFTPVNKEVLALLKGYPDIANKLVDTSTIYQPNWAAFTRNYDNAVQLWNRHVVR